MLSLVGNEIEQHRRFVQTAFILPFFGRTEIFEEGVPDTQVKKVVSISQGTAPLRFAATRPWPETPGEYCD